MKQKRKQMMMKMMKLGMLAGLGIMAAAAGSFSSAALATPPFAEKTFYIQSGIALSAQEAEQVKGIQATVSVLRTENDHVTVQAHQTLDLNRTDGGFTHYTSLNGSGGHTENSVTIDYTIQYKDGSEKSFSKIADHLTASGVDEAQGILDDGKSTKPVAVEVELSVEGS